MSGTDQVAEDATDEELYAWFIDYLAHGRPVEDEGLGVCKIDGFELRVTPAQLRSVAWVARDVYRDSALHSSPKTATPVGTGLLHFAFEAEEMEATLEPDERYLVFKDGRLWRSVTPGPVPRRSANVTHAADDDGPGPFVL